MCLRCLFFSVNLEILSSKSQVLAILSWRASNAVRYTSNTESDSE